MTLVSMVLDVVTVVSVESLVSVVPDVSVLSEVSVVAELSVVSELSLVSELAVLSLVVAFPTAVEEELLCDMDGAEPPPPPPPPQAERSNRLTRGTSQLRWCMVFARLIPELTSAADHIDLGHIIGKQKE